MLLIYCAWTARHFGGGAEKGAKGGGAYSLCAATMDSVHLSLFHLEQLGLRCAAQSDDIESDEALGSDGGIERDVEMRRMALEIVRARSEHAFERIDTQNSAKFNIAAQAEHGDDDGAEATKSERMREHIAERVADAAAKGDFYEFIAAEEFESDAVLFDVADAAQSNLRRFGSKLGHALNDFLRTHRVDAAQLSTGFLFWYWPWYAKQSDAEVKQQWKYQRMDFGGYTVAELCVSPRFDSLKSEILSSGFVGAKEFQEQVIDKGNAYLRTAICRKMKTYRGFDDLHYDIPYGSPLRAHHLFAVVLYTDFSDLCFAFGRSFRKIKWNESFAAVKERNAKFYFLSRYLREAVTYYGNDGYVEYGGEKGPFFTGMKGVMNMPSFALALNGPTSTSKQKAVATRFAGDGGMVIVLDNQRGNSFGERFWDCSWLSAFTEEDERLWFGSFGCKVEVASVIIIESALNYSRSMDAFWKFDAILSAQERMCKVEVSARNVSIVGSAMCSALGEPFAANPNCDAYALDNFFAFTRHKTQILLNLYSLNQMKDRRLTDFVMHNVEKQSAADISEDFTNVLKPRIFALFPNLQHITITSASDFALNLQSLLSVLCDAVLPPSFETLIIKDNYGEWLKSAFSKEIEGQFDEKKLHIELQTEKGPYSNEDWVVVSHSCECVERVNSCD